ncbi:hypothetical protein O0L34_g3163 [Tuta absoluta]|nr:hypothetical protein O0L34_g3163 [Tuta absoluta]
MWPALMTPIILGCIILFSSCKDGTPLIVPGDKTGISNETAKQVASVCGVRGAPACRDTAAEHSALETDAGIGNQEECPRKIELETCPPLNTSAPAIMMNNNSVAISAGNTMKVEEVVTEISVVYYLIVLLLLKLAVPRRIVKVISKILLCGRVSTKTRAKFAAKQPKVVVTVNCAHKPVLVCVVKKAAPDGARMLVRLSRTTEQARVTKRYLVDCRDLHPSARVLGAVLAAHLYMTTRQQRAGAGGGAHQHHRRCYCACIGRA